MKKICSSTIIFFVLTSIASFAQQTSLQPLQQMSNHDLAMEYLTKSKSQKKTATILGISGAVMGTAALVIGIIELSNWNSNSDKNGNGLDNAGEILTAGAVALVVTAIPFALSAKHNKKKAELLLQSNNVPATSFHSKKVFSVGVAINL